MRQVHNINESYGHYHHRKSFNFCYIMIFVGIILIIISIGGFMSGDYSQALITLIIGGLLSFLGFKWARAHYRKIGGQIAWN
jgi:uncharacterized membrane protein